MKQSVMTSLTILLGGGVFEETGGSEKLAEIKKIVKDNKKKIAIIAGAAVALIAISVALNKKGKKKEAETVKKAATEFKAQAKEFTAANAEVVKNKSMAEAEALNRKVTKAAEKATEKKDKAKAGLPAVIEKPDAKYRKTRKLNDRFVYSGNKAREYEKKYNYYGVDKIVKIENQVRKKYGKNPSKWPKHVHDRIEKLYQNANKTAAKKYTPGMRISQQDSADAMDKLNKIERDMIAQGRRYPRGGLRSKDGNEARIKAWNALTDRERRKLTKEEFIDQICGDLYLEYMESVDFED